MLIITVVLYLLIACCIIVSCYVQNDGQDFGLSVFVGVFWIISVPVALLKSLGDYILQRRRTDE